MGSELRGSRTCHAPKYQHGDPVPEKELASGLMRREQYLADPSRVQTRGGFSLLDLKRYVDGRGYQGIGFGQLQFQDLVKHAHLSIEPE